MKALVTGACGFVAPHLIRHLSAMGDEVAGIYRNARSAMLSNSYVMDLLDRSTVVECIKDFAPDVIYHLAGMSFVPDANSNFLKAVELNVGITEILLSTCIEVVPRVRFLYVSSGEVYGKVESSKMPITESCTVNPANYYSLTKAMGEMVVNSFASKLQTIIVRPFNHIGPGQDSRFVTSTFAHQLARIAHGLQEPVLKVGNLDAQRDFTDVSDIVAGYRLAALRGFGVYNFCSGTPISINRILHELINLSGLRVTIEQDLHRMRPSENPIIYGSCARAVDDLHWKPLRSIDESLKSIYEYWYDEIGKIV
jgi:GDP-4-dehydro-6-deoxy-D-mannose reductase